MHILGLNAYHGDVSAVLVRDGQLVAAIEEERFRRIKHCAGFPDRAIAECLRIGKVEARDVDLFAVSRSPRVQRPASHAVRRTSSRSHRQRGARQPVRRRGGVFD